jgi:hypothetical protein
MKRLQSRRQQSIDESRSALGMQKGARGGDAALAKSK